MSSTATRRRVAIVASRQAFAELLAAALDASDDLTCAGHGADPDHVSHGDGLGADPDVVVLDLPGDGRDLPQVIDRIQLRWPQAWPLVLTGAHHPLGQLQPFTAVDRACAMVDLLDEVRAAGRTVLTVPAKALRAARRRPDGDTRYDGVHLTPRERDVLALLTDGHGAPAIAARLGMSVHTCRGHLKTLMSKFGVHSQVELAMRVTSGAAAHVPPSRPSARRNPS